MTQSFRKVNDERMWRVIIVQNTRVVPRNVLEIALDNSLPMTINYFRAGPPNISLKSPNGDSP